MSRAENIRCTQLEKTLKRLGSLSSEEQATLEAMTKSIITKILKDPVQYLKTNGSGNHCEMIKKLFQLNTDEV
jgi:glutamyl-tRNA reductase